MIPTLIFNVLTCIQVNGYQLGSLPLSWNQPSLVPRCLSSHLEFFKWIGYRGNEDDKQLLRFILANSMYLKKATIILTSTYNLEDKEITKKELKSMSRVSTSSELVFEWRESCLISYYLVQNDRIYIKRDHVYTHLIKAIFILWLVNYLNPWLSFGLPRNCTCESTLTARNICKP